MKVGSKLKIIYSKLQVEIEGQIKKALEQGCPNQYLRFN